MSTAASILHILYLCRASDDTNKPRLHLLLPTPPNSIVHQQLELKCSMATCCLQASSQYLSLTSIAIEKW